MDQSILRRGDALHSVRDRRNDVTHEFEETLTWQALDHDVAEIQAALHSHKLVEHSPTFTFRSERSQARASSDPTILYCWGYRFYVQEGDRVVAEVAWVKAVKKRSSSNEAK